LLSSLQFEVVGSMQIDVGRDDRRQMLQVTFQDRISRRAEMQAVEKLLPKLISKNKGVVMATIFFPRILRRAAALLETFPLTLLVYQLACGLKSGDKHHMLERA
jgi:hypothetical protein